MEKYEITYFTAPADDFDVSKTVEKHGGKIIKSENLGIRDLAYPVKKLTEGKYVSAIFTLNPENLIDLEKNVKQEKVVARYILIKALRDKKPLKERKPAIERAASLEEALVTEKVEEAEKELIEKPQEILSPEPQEQEPKPAKEPKTKAKAKKPAVKKSEPGTKAKKTAEDTVSSTDLDEKLKELVED